MTVLIMQFSLTSYKVQHGTYYNNETT